MRVAVTTATDRAENAAAIVTGANLEPVLLPCIRIQRADEPALAEFRAKAARADLVVATSARAIEVTWPQGMAALRVAAVGEATAAAARAAGAEVTATGTGGAEALVGQLAHLSGSTIAYPHAGGADPIVATRLSERGATVIDLIAYTAVPVSPPPDPVEAVIFGSPSAVAGWTSARSLDGLIVASIGPRTSQALHRVGAPPVVEPAAPRLEDLVAALAGHLNARIGP